MEDEKLKTFLCYQCKELIPIPPDFVGDKYALLEVHYLLKHDIDIRNVNWKKPMTIHRILDLESLHYRLEKEKKKTTKTCGDVISVVAQLPCRSAERRTARKERRDNITLVGCMGTRNWAQGAL